MNPLATMLPLDILIYLMAHFETRSALFQYAITCRSLYKASPPYLLAHSNTISSLFRLSSFCEFVLTDFPNRCRMLTNLHLLLWDSDYDLGKILVYWSRQYLELEPEVLGDLFATSTKLKNIELHSAEKTDTFRCLRTTTAPLTDLYLSFDTLEHDAWEDFSLKALLSSFPSVQNLDVDARGDLNSFPLRPDHEKLSAILHNLWPRHLLLSFVHTTYHSNHLIEKFKKPPIPIIAVVNGEIIVLDFTLTLEGANDSPLILLDVYTWVRMVKAPYLILNITIDAGTDRSPPL
ncbi:hypothetical protein ABKN59_010947 [Abortiporus biennis]